MTIPTVHHNRWLASAALHLLLNVWAVLDVLPEVANVAANLLVRLKREWDDRNEAKCEPLPGKDVSRWWGWLIVCVVWHSDLGYRVTESDYVNVKGQTNQRFITLPEKLPQFWHCTVMCSAPVSCELNAAHSLAVAMPRDTPRRHTVCPACEEEEHVGDGCALQMRS